MKRVVTVLMFAAMVVTSAGAAYAELGGQVFFRFGKSTLKDNRGNQAFTDANNVLGVGANDDDSGSSISAGLDIPLVSNLWGNTLLGEIMVEYSKFSDKKVTQTISAADLVTAGEGGLKPLTTSNVTVSVLNVVVAPKYRFELGKLRPWIIPVGLAFLVNSPPSDDTTYLDTGYHYGAGVEYMVSPKISVGVDYRKTSASGDPNLKSSYSNMSAYVGINF